MSVENLRELYVDELKDLYDAETQLVEALPKMEKNAHTSELKMAFARHLEQTKIHVQRLRQVLEELDASPGGKTCDAMKGLVKEGEKIIKETRDSDARDAALIAAAQKVEHYEIAGYGTVCAYAQLLGYATQNDLLLETLDEEKQTDEDLTELAEAGINRMAATS